MDKNYIDLHIHTTNSDGYFSPKEIVEMASKNDTSLIAISDHDSICGLPEFKENLKFGMHGIAGVEFSSYIMLIIKRLNFIFLVMDLTKIISKC